MRLLLIALILCIGSCGGDDPDGPPDSAVDPALARCEELVAERSLFCVSLTVSAVFRGGDCYENLPLADGRFCVCDMADGALGCANMLGDADVGVPDSSAP